MVSYYLTLQKKQCSASCGRLRRPLLLLCFDDRGAGGSRGTQAEHAAAATKQLMTVTQQPSACARCARHRWSQNPECHNYQSVSGPHTLLKIKKNRMGPRGTHTSNRLQSGPIPGMKCWAEGFLIQSLSLCSSCVARKNRRWYRSMLRKYEPAGC